MQRQEVNKVGKISTLLQRVPRTASNDDLYAPAPPDRVQSLDDLVHAVEIARNEKVNCQAELARAEQLEEDMQKRLATALNERNVGITVTLTRGRA